MNTSWLYSTKELYKYPMQVASNAILPKRVEMTNLARLNNLLSTLHILRFYGALRDFI